MAVRTLKIFLSTWLLFLAGTPVFAEWERVTGMDNQGTAYTRHRATAQVTGVIEQAYPLLPQRGLELSIDNGTGCEGERAVAVLSSDKYDAHRMMDIGKLAYAKGSTILVHVHRDDFVETAAGCEIPAMVGIRIMEDSDDE